MSTRSTPACTPDTVLYRGKLYRALNPIYAREPLSGRGAELYGGRFNPKGVPALYASLSVMTALREANQVGNLQPTTLVSYDAEIDSIFDCRDDRALKAEGIDAAELGDSTWRDQMKASGEAKTRPPLPLALADDDTADAVAAAFGAGAATGFASALGAAAGAAATGLVGSRAHR